MKKKEIKSEDLAIMLGDLSDMVIGLNENIHILREELEELKKNREEEIAASQIFVEKAMNVIYYQGEE